MEVSTATTSSPAHSFSSSSPGGEVGEDHECQSNRSVGTPVSTNVSERKEKGRRGRDGGGRIKKGGRRGSDEGGRRNEEEEGEYRHTRDVVVCSKVMASGGSQQLREKLKVARKWDLGFPTSLYTMDRSRVCLHIVNARSVGEIRDGDEGELNHHVISAIGGGTGEDKVRGDGDENAQEEEEGLGDHRVPSVNLVDAHPPKAGLETPELIVNVGEVACVQRPAMQ
ncbi:hypothetical protein BHM03_00011686 [Ensete ventricosum]|nr:hypothetical protein BHM03_00011686 [Ensete ventricosum]